MMFRQKTILCCGGINEKYDYAATKDQNTTTITTCY